MTPIIEITNLKKIFGNEKSAVVAVDSLNLVVNTGEIFGFLGPNGAGKTTTMRMLTTLLRPSSGKVILAGYDLTSDAQEVRKHIGYVSQSGGLERNATARENLILQGRIFGLTKQEAQERAEELITSLGLESFADRIVETYSGGQKRRADIALGMVNKPKILFLDEPTIGLDPQSRAQVWQEMRNLRSLGTTIFFTTHYLDEADLLCDRIAIVDHGKVIALDTPDALKKSIQSDTIVLGFPEYAESIENKKETEKIFSEIKEIQEIRKEKNNFRLMVSNGEAILPQILRICDKAGISISTISMHRPTLDDVFLRKTGRSLQQQEQTQEEK